MSELIGMDFQSAMETFAEAWAAANAGAAAVAQVLCKASYLKKNIKFLFKNLKKYTKAYFLLISEQKINLN